MEKLTLRVRNNANCDCCKILELIEQGEVVEESHIVHAHVEDEIARMEAVAKQFKVDMTVERLYTVN